MTFVELLLKGDAMTTATAADTRTHCPSWCTDHEDPPADELLHETSGYHRGPAHWLADGFSQRDILVELRQLYHDDGSEGDPVAVVIDGAVFLAPEQAQHLAEAILAAGAPATA